MGILLRVADDQTTAVVQRYLDQLAGVDGSAPAEPIIRELLAGSLNRLHLLCASMLFRSYPRLTGLTPKFAHHRACLILVSINPADRPKLRIRPDSPHRLDS